MKNDFIDIGSFVLTGDVMRVSDPCYEKDVWCCGTIKSCLPGPWNVKILKDSGRNALIVASHESCTLDMGGLAVGMRRTPVSYKHFSFEVGVDSGQAGFFDENYYQEDSVIDPTTITYDFSSWGSEHQLWYLACCDQTLQEPGAGCIPHGAVSSSGWGDGGYPGGYHKNKDGKIDRVFISFI